MLPLLKKILIYLPLWTFTMELHAIEEARGEPTKTKLTTSNWQESYMQVINKAYEESVREAVDENMRKRLVASYGINILKNGNNPAQPEHDWTLRGLAKASNIELLKHCYSILTSEYDYQDILSLPDNLEHFDFVSTPLFTLKRGLTLPLIPQEDKLRSFMSDPGIKSIVEEVLERPDVPAAVLALARPFLSRFGIR